ncbi:MULTISPECIES: DUF2919 domain-containing protein [Citrobacter]|uniref:DUF2919 domain-containing protein n=1 Tax=Citrobacter TaxID=544 RepID=UPI00107A65DB|nr:MULTISPECIES: DUF2919 domain-containing protein [Citrobacter]MBA4714257.1 DUF2919 domain-containing protein [Citrobacter pasteurii]MBA7942682.1 DUF2919 domain-containing protein [Citrobacter sp. RHBSTW-00271]MBD0802356.1 DUF2919 domain-containing protein [Citrobacter sp. C6_1]MBD0811282.1 DUF2919 domain-containing protein [Citrobacter sp. C6_2]MBJ8887067.1 DUF2919 domain-containing protein [Citrobacter sp. FDAARGOS_156]
MKSTEFHPADYDVHGCLRLPFLFWCVLLLQARTWVLFVIAGSSREQGNTLLNLFYPDHDAFWLGLLPGVPAVLAFLLSGRRFAFPVLWHRLRGLLILAQLVLLCWQPVMWLAGDPLNGVGLALLVADIVALVWLLTNQRLRACFSLEKE